MITYLNDVYGYYSELPVFTKLKGNSSFPLSNSTQVGIEVEVEGYQGIDNPPPLLDRRWKVVPDGSLRNNGHEFVLRKPMRGKVLENAIDVLGEALPSNAHASSNCSVHVHLDVRGSTLTQFRDLIMGYCFFEDLLFKLGGYHRRNSSFCRPLCTVSNVGEICSALDSGEFPRHLISRWCKYTALNLKAVEKYGSVEFRMLEGTTSTSRISNFINVLLHIKHYADTHGNIYELVSKEDGDAAKVLDAVFTDKATREYVNVSEVAQSISTGYMNVKGLLI